MDNDKDPSRFGSAELQALIVERATEAKSSASAAPGIDTPEFREICRIIWGGKYDALSPSLKHLVTHIDAAIAAAREEAARAWTKCDELEALNTNCNVVIADLRARLAAPEGELPPLPTFMRSHIERAIKEAEHPQGMSVNDGMARLNVGYLKRLLTLADAALAQPQAKAPQQPPAGEDTNHG